MKLSTLVLPACFLLFAGPASVAGSESSNLRGGIVGTIADATAAEDAVSTSVDASIALSPEANDGDGEPWAASIRRKLFIFGDDDDFIPEPPEIPPIPIPEIPIPIPEVPSCPSGDPGDGCSPVCPCKSGNSCEPGSQVCRGPGAVGDPCNPFRPCGSGLFCPVFELKCRGPGAVGDKCDPTRPCASGLSCHPVIQTCYNLPRREGQPCMAGHECGSGLNCQAGSQVCKAPGDVGDPCDPTNPCLTGLSCHPGLQTCYNLPRQEGQPCMAGHECGSGLSCEPFSQVCKAPGDVGDPCDPTRPCASHLYCDTDITCDADLSDCEGFVCREPGRHGDSCLFYDPASCADGFECVDLFDAKTKQGGGTGVEGHNLPEFPNGKLFICLPECVDVSSEIKSMIKNGETDGISAYGKKWDNGVMPYVVDCEMGKHERSPIALAMRNIEDRTDIRFERYDKEIHANYVIFDDFIKGDCDKDDKDECGEYHAAGVGRKETPGWQHVNIQGGWWNGVNLLTAAHEIMHALGWPHTQKRPDRDEFVVIHSDNIKDDGRHNFDKLAAHQSGSDLWESVQKCKPYNYKSVMHYSSKAMAIDKSEYTIETRDPSKQELLGNGDYLTDQDVQELQEYFFGPHCPPASVPPSLSFDRAPGKVGEDCDLTRPCGSGLSCHPGDQKCYDFPRKEGQPCAAWYDCNAGLNCEAVSQVCETVPAEPTASPVPTTEAPLAPEPTEISAPESTPTSAASKTATITAIFAAAIATLLLV